MRQFCTIDAISLYFYWVGEKPSAICYNQAVQSAFSSLPLRRDPLPAMEARVLHLLAEIFPEAEGQRWLETYHSLLGESPRGLLARGEGEKVLRLLTRLEQGIPT